MLRIICISFSCLVATSAYAQSPAPGGVPGAVVWRTSSAGENEGLYWIDRLSATKGAPLSGNELPLFNFHPVPWLRDTEVAPSLPLPTRSLEQVTVFAVHHPADTLTEKVVWSLGAGDGRPVVLTTHRLADLRDTSYLNFPGPEKALPGIKTYYQRRPAAEETTAPSSPALLPGAPPGRPQLPVSNYRGLLPELIVYDRVLSPQERLQVESYLALKYGLTLAGEADYLNSAGEVIWERRRQGAFVHRLAGIGRDDGAGLLQKQSTSSYEPELLTIAAGRPAPDNAANRSELPDQSWLIWGDDGGAWRLQPPEFAQPRRLDRSWRMTAHGFPPATTLQVDLGRFAPERTTGQTYWLLVDRSGTGKFAPGQVDFFPANEIDARGLASFFHIGWDADASGSDAFTLALGPAFLGLAWQEAPGCDPATPGRLFIGALGGQAPYRFQLDGPNGTERWQRDSGDLRELSGLPPGPYWLTVRDAAGALFRDSLFFQATDAPLSPLADEYTLAAGQELSLDAAVAGDGPRQYEWLAPDGRTHQGPQLNIRQPGAYQLTIERASCIARHLITVRAAPASPFREVALYPNPARREWPFQLAVHLTEAAAVQVSILDVGGRSIRERQLPADEYHLIRETLAAAGAYLIRVRSGGATQTLPLIVE